MDSGAKTTELIVRHHLKAFLDQSGIEAIVGDYDDAACLVTESRTYAGKAEIAHFFEAFIDSLPGGAIERFKLRSLRVEGELAYITWSVEGVISLGTDSFVVRRGRLVAQTVAMQAATSYPETRAA